MVECHDKTSSVAFRHISSCTSPNVNNVSPKSISDSEYVISMIEKNLKLTWTGDFQSVKCLVAEYTPTT